MARQNSKNKKNRLIRYEITDTASIAPGACVYRIDFGNKFFIWKGKEFPKCLDAFCSDVEWKIFNPEKCKEGDRMFEIVQHIRKYRTYLLYIKPLFCSEKPLEILDFEKNELLQHQEDPNCCNTIFEPHIPAWISGEANKASGEAVLPKPVDEVRVDKKVAKIKEKPLKSERIDVVSTSENLEMPDFDISDILGK